MRTHSRPARAAIALLGGLLIGGWLGGGLVWVLNRNKYKEPGTVGDVKLANAEELDMVPADAMGFAHARLGDLWKTESMVEFRRVVEKAGPEALKTLDASFAPAPSTVDRATVVMMKVLPRTAPPPAPPIGIGLPKGGIGVPKGTGPPKGPGLSPPPPPPPPPKGALPVPKQNPEPSAAAILVFSAPFVADKVRTANWPKAVETFATVDKKYWVDKESNTAVAFPTDRIMLIGAAPAVEALLVTEPKKEGPLTPAIKMAATGTRHIVAALNMSQASGELPPALTTEIGPLLRAESATIGIVIGSGAKVDLRAMYADENAAQEADKSMRSAAESGRKKLADMKRKMEADLSGPAAGTRHYSELPQAVSNLFGLGAINVLDEWLAEPNLVREGKEISTTVNLGSMGGTYLGLSGVAMGLMIPATQKVREAAVRSADRDNLIQIGLAFHNYSNVMGDSFPGPQWGTKLVNGRPTGNLSWRMALLPYLGEETLYKQFKWDEPWDSENNKKLIPQVPKVYVSPLAAAEAGKTYYKVFVGKGTIFDRTGARYKISNIPDGSSNTILAAEGGTAVTWTKPDDFEFDPDRPLPDIWLPGKLGINVLMADGAVRFVNRSTSERTLKLAIHGDDGPPDW